MIFVATIRLFYMIYLIHLLAYHFIFLILGFEFSNNYIFIAILIISIDASISIYASIIQSYHLYLAIIASSQPIS